MSGLASARQEAHHAHSSEHQGVRLWFGHGAGCRESVEAAHGTIGAIAGVVAAIGTTLVIPGLGILIAGPIVAGIAGAGAGGIAGGVIGALVGSGIPEERAKLYESGIENGNVVLGVNPRNEEDAKYFEENWRSNNAEDIYRKF